MSLDLFMDCRMVLCLNRKVKWGEWRIRLGEEGRGEGGGGIERGVAVRGREIGEMYLPPPIFLWSPMVV